MGGKISALRRYKKKQPHRKIDEAARYIILFKSECEGLFFVKSAHRDWSIPQARSYSQGISHCFC